MRKKNTVIMSVSILVAALFIGIAMTPVTAQVNPRANAVTDSEITRSAEQAEAIAEVAEEIAAEIVAEELEASSIAEQAEAIAEVAEEGCSPCADEAQAEVADPAGGCENCGEAVVFAIEHMQIDMEGYLEDLLEDGWYFLATADFILEATGSLVYWFAHSGYEIELDVEELAANVQYWVELLVGPQQHLITLFLAALFAIGIGIGTYLIVLCMGAGSVPGSAPSALSTSQETAQSSEVTAATATIPINTIIRSTEYGSMGL